MSWKPEKICHNTCVHLVYYDGITKECGVTILETKQHGWLCPMHDRAVVWAARLAASTALASRP